MFLRKLREKYVSLKGKLKSEETRMKMSESKKGAKHPLFGKHHTEETRQKMRESIRAFLKKAK